MKQWMWQGQIGADLPLATDAQAIKAGIGMPAYVPDEG